MRPFLIFTLLAVGMTSSAAPPKQIPPKTAPSEFERDMMLRFHMHQSFDLVRAIERLLIRGKLDQAKEFATAIASAPEMPAHGPWTSHVVEVRDQAAALARVVDRGTTYGDILQLCASCHMKR